MKISYEQRDMLIRTMREAFDGLVTVYDRDDRASGTTTWEVNWSCMGSQPTDVARNFAHRLTLGCEIADWLNEHEVSTHYTISTPWLDDHENRTEMVETVSSHLVMGWIDTAMEELFKERK